MSIAWPCAVCATSGWNCTPARRPATSSNAATGAPGEPAVTMNPSGAAVTLSPWLIQTGSVAGRSRSSTPASAETASGVPPNSRCPVCATVPPSACAIAWNP